MKYNSEDNIAMFGFLQNEVIIGEAWQLHFLFAVLIKLM